jgi:hypothetical protein
MKIEMKIEMKITNEIEIDMKDTFNPESRFVGFSPSSAGIL